MEKDCEVLYICNIKGFFKGKINEFGLLLVEISLLLWIEESYF